MSENEEFFEAALWWPTKFGNPADLPHSSRRVGIVRSRADPCLRQVARCSNIRLIDFIAEADTVLYSGNPQVEWGLIRNTFAQSLELLSLLQPERRGDT